MPPACRVSHTVRVQDNSYEGDPVMEALLQLLDTDKNKVCPVLAAVRRSPGNTKAPEALLLQDVRAAVLNHLPICQPALAATIKRTQDLSDQVGLSAVSHSLTMMAMC